MIANTRRLVCVLLLAVLGIGASINASAQLKQTPIPQLVGEDGRYKLVVDGQPFFILGGQCGNSSNWPAVLPTVWSTLKLMNANTLEIPIYWEEIEPVQGKYDFKSVQRLLDQAREQDIRLVLLWFATWKNGSNHYMPEWMKLESGKYPNILGKDGKQVDSPSPHCKAAMEADAKAFTAVMQYLKDNDPCHTVIMVQVQNEPGSWGSVRDYSKLGNKLFKQQVPPALLTPAVLNELGVPVVSKGTWSEVFGERADEYFQAWSVASYIEYVAAAGKKVNPLPMYVNVALRDPFGNPPATNYESGGATDNVIPIYKVAAPHIDLVAPDIYQRGDANYTRSIELYTRNDNALMVPETSGGSNKYLYEVVKQGIGFSPFGVDKGYPNINDNINLGRDYKLLKPIADKIAQWSFERRIYAAFEPENHAVRRLDLGQWEAILVFGQPRRSNDIPETNTPSEGRSAWGKAMIVKLDEGDFLVAGNNVRFTFRPLGRNEGKAWHYLRVEEGCYNDSGEWEMKRVLNGDETDWTGPYAGPVPTMLRIRVYARENAK